MRRLKLGNTLWYLHFPLTCVMYLPALALRTCGGVLLPPGARSFVDWPSDTACWALIDSCGPVKLWHDTGPSLHTVISAPAAYPLRRAFGSWGARKPFDISARMIETGPACLSQLLFATFAVTIATKSTHKLSKIFTVYSTPSRNANTAKSMLLFYLNLNLNNSFIT